MQAINFELVPQRIKQFFKSAVFDTMDERAKRRIFRPDLIQVLMAVRNERIKYHHSKVNVDKELNSENNRAWTDDELVAQCFACFLGSFDSVAYVVAFMVYELALNQQIQQKLYNEIQTINQSLNGGPLTYDALSKLKYLDQVIDETLRKWPPTTFTSRKCTKDIKLNLGDGKKVSIERGIMILLPISGVHR